MTFEERKRRIVEIAATKYQSNDDAAQEYLLAIEGSTLSEQKKLFAAIISLHGAVATVHQKSALKKTIAAERWKTVAESLSDMVRGWARTADRLNCSLEETACTLWDHLTLREAGEDRIVALDLLLRRIAPYAQMPADLTTVKPLDCYHDAHSVLLKEIALLKRVQRLEEVTITEVAAACEKLLSQIEDRTQRTALLKHFIESVFSAANEQIGLNLIVEIPYHKDTD